MPALRAPTTRVAVVALLSAGLLAPSAPGAVQAPAEAAFSSLGCAVPPPLPRSSFDVASALQPSAGRTYALLLNGGGRPEINYQSHVQHLRGALAVLRARGVPSDAITVFSSDGDDPTEDQATRAVVEDPSSWLLPEDAVGQALRPPIVYVDSAIEGVTLHAASKAALGEWFAASAGRLLPGDTLIVYVTDHGDKNEKDLANNAITLWGGESLSVTELKELLARLDPGVRVVLLMSQCYAGSFANAIYRDGRDGVPAGNVCGYFAATADRWAYGCYPENRGKDGIGYSHHLLEGLTEGGRLADAHRETLVTDRTPDVPHTTADFFLERRLKEEAEGSGREPRALVDALLAEAWRDRAAWEPEIRLLDAVGESFGSFSPRSLAELEEQAEALPELSKRLQTYAGRWHDALESLRRENLARFFDAYPTWRKRLDPKVLDRLDSEVRGRIRGELLAVLAPFTEGAAERQARLLALRRKADDAEAASYRAEVRLGVVLRMRALLTSIAGRVYLRRYATADERQAYRRLSTCEDLTLRGEAGPPVARAQPFPPLAEERRLIESLMPAYMGIHFRPLPDSQRKRYATREGAVTVLNVNPDSPAAAAGLQVGDIVLGPPGAPFTEPEQVREWTMWREIGVPADLEVLRDAHPMQVTLKPGPYPLELPRMPGPPQVGSAAPPMKAEVVRGAERLTDGKPRLLFFWATWCVICKHALPEVLAFGELRNVEIVAVSDEDPEIIGRFLADTADQPFPTVVASDPLRSTFQAYGVSGTPTFVLVDGENVVRHVQTGYRDGLHIEGWKWDERVTSPAAAAILHDAQGAAPRSRPHH